MIEIDIYNLTLNIKKEIVNEGYTLYLNNLIKDIDYLIKDEILYFTAYINNNEYIISFDENSNLIYPKLDENLSNINYYIAFLFKIKKELEGNINLSKNNMPLINKIINHYKKEFNKREYDKIVPYLSYDGDNYFDLELKIGNNNFYMVKNIKNLINDIKERNLIKYGNYYSTNHDINLFDSQSNKLISFLKNIYENEELKKPELYYKNFNRYLFLTPSMFDSFFDYYQNSYVTLNEEEIYFKVSNPKIKIVLENDELKLLDKNFKIIQGSSKTYILKDKILFRTRYDYKNNMIPLIEALQNNNTININDLIIKDFYSFVFPKIESYIDYKLSNKINLYDLTIKSYLDYQNEHLVINYDFLYSGLKESDDESIIPNKKKEQDFINQLEEFGFKYNQMKDLDKIIYFMENDIKKLMELSEVFVSDYLRKIEIKKLDNLKTSIKYNESKIKIEFLNLDFNQQELKELLYQYSLKKRYYKLKNKDIIDLNTDFFKELNGYVDILNLDIANIEKEIEIPLYKAITLNNFLEDNNLFCLTDDSFKSFIKEIKDYKNIEYEIPKSIKSFLKPFQTEAFKWLKILSKYSLSGILADDMGLGKTIEIISLLLDNDEKTIIVCPTSLIYNWEYELKRFGLSNRIYIINSNVEDRIELINNINPNSIVLTSYDILKNDIDYYNDIKFKYVILDEAQHIKNPKTLKALAVKKLNSDIRFALTGTPIENNISDLWSIFDFLMPGYLKSFNEFYFEYSSNKNFDNLKIKIKPFILRRTKKEVLKDLPDKIETTIYTKLSSYQQKLYDAQIFNFFENKNINKLKIFNLLTRLRQICDHPSLFLDNYDNGSSKLDLLIELIGDYIDKGHKILVFSQFTSMLKIISEQLNNLNINHLVLTGETDKKERMNLVNNFNSNYDINVFLISLKAGGVGLNLTSADIVIHYDPWWNLSLENQATDRTHRIGQDKVVEVVKLITTSTIEEKIRDLQNEKIKLSNDLLDENSYFNKLSIKELISIIKD